MKTYIMLLAFAMCTLGLVAQSEIASSDVKIGAIFEIGATETNTYKHIDFPRPNIIMKRGGFPNKSDIVGSLVVVKAIKKKNDGTTEVTIKQKDGTRFFGSHRTIKADLNAAIESGELKSI